MNNKLNNQQTQNIHSDSADAPPKMVALFSKATEVTLTTEEKSAGQMLLQEFMDKNPISVEIAANTSDASKKSTQTERKTFYTEYFKTLFVRDPRLVYALAVVVLVFGFGASAVAANDSIPGELLYPIKRQVNERVERVVAVSTTAKAKVAVKQAVTRLEETQKLIEKKEIPPQTRVAIDASIEQSSRDVARNIERLEKEGQITAAIKISSDFEKKLDIQEKAISKRLESAQIERVKIDLSNTREYIRNKISTSTTRRLGMESKLAITASSTEEVRSKNGAPKKDWKNRNTTIGTASSSQSSANAKASTSAGATVIVPALMEVDVKTTNTTGTSTAAPVGTTTTSTTTVHIQSNNVANTTTITASPMNLPPVVITVPTPPIVIPAVNLSL